MTVLQQRLVDRICVPDIQLEMMIPQLNRGSDERINYMNKIALFFQKSHEELLPDSPAQDYTTFHLHKKIT